MPYQLEKNSTVFIIFTGVEVLLNVGQYHILVCVDTKLTKEKSVMKYHLFTE